MQYRLLHGTALSLSAIAFGCGGNAGLMVRGGTTQRRTAIARALELGINYFDNSPDYGDGLAESNLGVDLQALGARPLLNTKVEIRQADHVDIARHVERSVEESLTRLRVDAIDVLQIHNGPCGSLPQQAASDYARLWIEHYFRPSGALDGLERVKRSGKVKHVGFICRANDVVAIRQLIDTGLFRLINVPYTLLNPTAGGALADGLAFEQDFGGVIPYAHARGVGCAIYSPLASGDLTDAAIAGTASHPLARRRNAGTPAHRRSLERAAAFRFLKGTGRTLAQSAVRFVLMHPGVTTVLGGFSDLAQIEEIATVPHSPALSPDDLRHIEEVWRQHCENPV